MKVFIFDTETTGFTVRDGSLEEQPYIVQFAGIMIEIAPQTGDWSEMERINQLVKPRISIPFTASQVNGIYDRDVVDAPYIEDCVDRFLKPLNNADAVVGHNIEYDEEVLRNELARIGKAGYYHPQKSFCTMRLSTDYCKLE